MLITNWMHVSVNKTRIYQGISKRRHACMLANVSAINCWFSQKNKIKKNVELLLGCSLIGQQQPNQLMWWIILPLLFSAQTPLLTLRELISYLCSLLWSSTSRSCNILWSWDFWYLILEPTSHFNFGHILYSFPLT